MAEYKLNYPIETDEAKKFWESRHRLNRIKAIIAFSLDLDNANDNLRREGYHNTYRRKYLDLYQCYVNRPDMQSIPFSGLDELWYEPKPCTMISNVPPLLLVPDTPDDAKYIVRDRYGNYTITLSTQLFEIVSFHFARGKPDGSPDESTGYGCTVSGVDSDIVVFAQNDREVTVSAGTKAGTNVITVTSGDKKTTVRITIVVK
ncbi:hypothetical protein R3B00_001302 [Klebsiella pneumoniae]|nr:hypothetical protein [Klebsiella pneumoniae]ELQ8980640.1 hypothetical protein [Klebsiella pneumoniae]